MLLCGLACAVALAAAALSYYFATLYRAGPAQQGYLALTGATVLVGDDLEPRQATVLIRDGTIIAVGAPREVDITASADVIDLRGYTLLPGLIDLHVHLGFPDTGGRRGLLSMPKLVADAVRFAPDQRRALLRHGVTTVRSVGDERAWITDLRRRIADGSLEGPRVFAAGPVFTTSNGHPVATFGIDAQSEAVRVPGSPAAARSAVRDLAASDEPVDLIKVVQERGRPRHRLQPIDPSVLTAIVDEAHTHGLPVTAHWGTPDDLEEVLAAGVDGLEHVEPRGVGDGWPSGALDSLVERSVSLTPTLTVSETALPPQTHRRLRERVGEFHAAGGRVVTGTDSPIRGVRFGSALHRELELLVDSGLSPRQALQAATSEAARALGADRLGAVAPGRVADLVVVDGDPLQDVTATRNVAMVFRDGRTVLDNRAKEDR